MFDCIPEPSRCTARFRAKDAPLREFVHAHHDALLHAAALLGGPTGTTRAQAVIDALLDGQTSARKLRGRLNDLLDLLTLQHVHEEGRPEAACFAEIAPWDPVVEEICLLTDGLSDAIDAWEAAHDGYVEAPDDHRAAA